MIITNKLPKVFYYGKVRILPGSNVIDNGTVDVKNPVIKALIAEGSFIVDNEVTDETAAKAIEAAETQGTVDKILEATPKASEQTKEKAKKRKKDLDAFDAKVQAEIDAAKAAKANAEA